MNDQAPEAVAPPMNNGFLLDDAGVLRSGSLLALEWLDHGFGTRNALDWPPPWGSMATLKQVHSNRVEMVCGPVAGVLGEGDGLVSAEPEQWLAVRTADCASLILADPAHRAVAVIHAGWRGTVSQIAAAALDRMRCDFGSNPIHLTAAIGPAIGPCCFEVGPEVALQFQPWWPERSDLNRRAHLDLVQTLVRQLTQQGVPADAINAFSGCTQCNSELFHSFRRDKEHSGRMVTAAASRKKQSGAG